MKTTMTSASALVVMLMVLLVLVTMTPTMVSLELSPPHADAGSFVRLHRPPRRSWQGQLEWHLALPVDNHHRPSTTQTT